MCWSLHALSSSRKLVRLLSKHLRHFVTGCWLSWRLGVIIKRWPSCYFGLPIFETRCNVNSRPLELKSGVLGPLSWWSILGKVNCSKYVVLWHYSRLAAFLSRYFGPSIGCQFVTFPPIFPTPQHPNGWCSHERNSRNFFDAFPNWIKNYFAISGFLSTCSLSTNRELLSMISQHSLMRNFFIFCATF
jgi:hypothetical protein